MSNIVILLLTLLALASISFIIMAAAFYHIKFKIKQRDLTLNNQNNELLQLNELKSNLELELTTLQNKLQNAIEDPITQLQGWQLFEDRIKHAVIESARYQFTLAVLYFDLNRFHIINQALGHQIGDAVLNEVAKRLQVCVRQVDSIARFSKDVFVVLLEQLTRPETAAIVAQRILQSLMEPIEIKEHKLYVTASIGISIYPGDGADAAALMRNADHALQLAKKKGNQHYQFYHEQINANSVRELAISTGLKRDSLLNELEIFYHPIKNIQNHTIFAVEALLHWRHPELGLISSEELFQYAEQHGESNLLFEQLLRMACKQFLQGENTNKDSHARENGDSYNSELNSALNFSPSSPLLAIPLSIKQLENNHFVHRISQILKECRFHPEKLLLEIKGNLTDVSFDVLEKSLNMLKYLNIKLALNHFGCGHFSIYDLKNFSVNYLKLDPVFMNDIEQNQETKNMIKAMVELAESLSADLIVCGVNTEQQMRALAELGCSLMQGEWVDAAAGLKFSLV